MIGASHPFGRRTLNALDENGNEGCSVCGRPRDVHPEPGGAAPRFRDYLHEDEIIWPGAWRLKGEEYEVPFGEALPGGPASFTCPACGMTSHHPDDAAHGYCGSCHAFTGDSPAAWYYTVRVDPRGRPDPDTGPDGPLTREEALAPLDDGTASESLR